MNENVLDLIKSLRWLWLLAVYTESLKSALQMQKMNGSIASTANVVISSLKVATRTELCNPNGTADCRNYTTFSTLASLKCSMYWEKAFLYYLQLLRVENISFQIFDQFQSQNLTTAGIDANTVLGSIATENADLISYPVTYSYERLQIVRYALPFINLRACFSPNSNANTI